MSTTAANDDAAPPTSDRSSDDEFDLVQHGRNAYTCYRSFYFHCLGMGEFVNSGETAVDAGLVLIALVDEHVLQRVAKDDLAVVLVKMLSNCSECGRQPAVLCFAVDEGMRWIQSQRILCIDCFAQRVTHRHWDTVHGRCGQNPPGPQEEALRRTCDIVQRGAGLHTLPCLSQPSRILELDSNRGSTTAVAYSPDGTTIATASASGLVDLSDATTGNSLRVLRGHGLGVLAVTYSFDGKTIASGGRDNTARLWDAESGQCLHVLEGHTDCVSAVVFTANGTAVATGSHDCTVQLRDVATGDRRLVLRGHTAAVSSVAVSPDGRTVLSGSWDETARVWEASTGCCRRVLRHTDNLDAQSSYRVHAVAYSLDGATIATGSDDMTVWLWNAASGKCRRVLRGDGAWRRPWYVRGPHEPPFNISSLAYSPDGATIAASGSDNSVRLWDAVSGECRGVLQSYPSDIASFAYSPDGSTIVTCGTDSSDPWVMPRMNLYSWEVPNSRARAPAPALSPKRHRSEAPAECETAQTQSVVDPPSITLDAPVPTSTPYDSATCVALEKGGKRWLVDRAGLMAYSKVARNLLEHADDDEVLPLDGNPHCTETVVALFATWINHYASSPTAVPTKVSYPVKCWMEYVVTPWDRAFIETLVVPGGDMTNSNELWPLAGMAVYLGCTVLMELCCAYVAVQVRGAAEDNMFGFNDRTPTAMIRSWFGLEGDISSATEEQIVEDLFWCIMVDHRELQKDSEEAHALVNRFRRRLK